MISIILVENRVYHANCQGLVSMIDWSMTVRHRCCCCCSCCCFCCMYLFMCLYGGAKRPVSLRSKYIQQKQQQLQQQQQHLCLTVMLQSTMLTKPRQFACKTLFSAKNMLTNLKFDRGPCGSLSCQSRPVQNLLRF